MPAAAITDKFTQATVNSRPVPTTVSSIRAAAGSTLSCLALTGWPTGTAVHFITYKITTAGLKIAGSQIDWKGIVSGTTITNLTLEAGSDVGNAIGDVVECAPTAAWANDFVAGMTAQHTQLGAHTGVTTDTIVASGSITAASFIQSGGASATDWTVGIPNPNTITDNGNRSYSMVFNGSDQTSLLSPGMRLKLGRTVTAPTQCTSLNGTTQFYSRASGSVGGMTFTNNFVVSAWIKLSSYANGAIASRYNGTSGWSFELTTAGQIALNGWNAGAANVGQIISYQSVPLNKWVHVAAQLDMTSTTNSPTVNYTMIDGVDVPAGFGRGGSSPISILQAGNLEIGSRNAGTTLFPGKIAQVAIYNAKVAQATILASKNQTLAGTETSLISAYSFNNSINDLSVTGNNLTANNGAVATNADTCFTQTLGLTGYTPGTTNFAIIMTSSFSTNTTLVVQIPEGDTLPTSGGINAVSYSTQAVPFGFPKQRGKWQVRMDAYAAETVSISGLNTYTPSNKKLTIPIGEWVYSTQGPYSFESSVGGIRSGYLAAGVSAPILSGGLFAGRTVALSGNSSYGFASGQYPLSLAAQTTYTVFGDIDTSSGSETYVLRGDQGGFSMIADNAYL